MQRTSSLEALKAFTEGDRVLNKEGDAAAIPFYKHAVELDPDFALAYAHLGITHTTIGEPDLGAAYTRKAYELSKRTSEPERYFITATYFKEVTGNLKTAEQTCQLWIQAYPRSEKPHVYLSGAIYPEMGEYDKAVEAGKEAVRLSPETPVPYAFLMFAQIEMNRFDEAKATYQRATERKLSSPFFQQGLYQIAFLENNVPEMERQVKSSAGKPGGEVLLILKAETAAYSGHLREASEISQQAIDSAERSGEKEAVGSYIAQSSVREGFFGNADEARRRAVLAMQHSAGRDVQYGAALAFAYAGNGERAQSLTDNLARRFPEDTIVQFNYLPTLRARLYLNRGKVPEAIQSLEIAERYELGGTTGGSYGWNALFPVYVRGQAYLDARKGAEAAAEFQKIIDYRGVVVNEPIGPLAHLGLARAFALQGDQVKSRAAYRAFLTLWKDADPGMHPSSNRPRRNSRNCDELAFSWRNEHTARKNISSLLRIQFPRALAGPYPTLRRGPPVFITSPTLLEDTSCCSPLPRIFVPPSPKDSQTPHRCGTRCILHPISVSFQWWRRTSFLPFFVRGSAVRVPCRERIGRSQD